MSSVSLSSYPTSVDLNLMTLGSMAHFFPGRKENTVCVFRKFLKQGCLTYPPSSIHHQEFEWLAVIQFIQMVQFFFSSNHFFHLISNLLTYE